ncbi:hypothetical protein ACFFHJ_28965 [Planotetraspora thailandica]|nr:hypothetical protein [Planotetraspora thailandica]
MSRAEFDVYMRRRNHSPAEAFAALTGWSYGYPALVCEDVAP